MEIIAALLLTIVMFVVVPLVVTIAVIAALGGADRLLPDFMRRGGSPVAESDGHGGH